MDYARTELKFLIFLFIFFLLFDLVGPVRAEQKVWKLKADFVRSYTKAKIVEAKGNVFLTNGQDFLKADYVRYYQDTSWIYLEGNVTISWQGDVLQGKQAEFDLIHKTGWVKQGRLFLPRPHVYITSNYLQKKSADSYVFKQATLTSCDGQTPAWSLATDRGIVTVEGYARLYGTSFRIRNKPILYSPFLIVPVKNKRQSGFLLPQLGYSSTKGFNYNQPYYQVINPEQDLTWYENYYSKKGIMHGLEYRLTPNELTKGWFRFDYLYDPQAAWREKDELEMFQRDGLIRPNHQRFWLRGKLNSFLFSPEYNLKLDLDYVSDQNYLREFKRGYSGFNQSNKLSLKEFGRSFEPADDLSRTSTVSLSRNFDFGTLTSKLVYTENLRYKNHNLEPQKDPTPQRFPEIDFDLSQLHYPFFSLDMRANSVYFWRKYGTRAERLDLYPEISKIFQVGYFTFIPKLRYRETLYFIDRFENEPVSVDTDKKLLQRGIFDFYGEASTELYKIYSLGQDQSSLKLKHSIRPELSYSYRPNKDQSYLPSFDSLDRLTPKNELSYSLRNSFTLRHFNNNKTKYFHFLDLNFNLNYDFREARRKQNLNKYPKRPFSDLEVETILRASSYFNLNSKTYYSFYLHQITQHEHLLTLTWPQKISTYFGLDYTGKVDEFKRHTSSSKILKLGGDILFIPHLKISWLFRRDLLLNKNLEENMILKYMHQCFSIQLDLSKTDYDQRIGISFNLLNLG